MRIGITVGGLALAFMLATPASAQTSACCAVTGIDARAGVVTAKVNTTSQTFQFKVADVRVVRRLRVGQAVYANFTTNQVSLDGRRPCCTITQGPRGGLAVRAPTRDAKAPLRVTDATTAVSPVSFDLPQVTYGEPIVVQRDDRRALPTKAPRAEMRRITARVAGVERVNDVMMIRGLDGLEKATGLHESARKLLRMHLRTLRPGESNHYIVNPRAADEWFKTRTLPAHLDDSPPTCDLFSSNPALKAQCVEQWRLWVEAHPNAGGGGSGCGSPFESVNCLEETVQDVGEGFSDAWEAMWESANETWKHWTGELEKAWDATQGCFADHTLPGPRTPVKFSITPSIPVDLEKSASKGEASGTVKGSVRLGVPIEADFQAKASFFYIPCLPFVVRPKNLTAEGEITVGQQLDVAVEASGQVRKRFKIPPTGGPQIPVVIIPIVIGGVPVAILDVSAYIEGEVDLAANGKAIGQFTFANSHRSSFDFTCDGEGCDGKQKGTTPPATTTESARIEGQVSVSPGIFTALQLSLNYGVLGARAGPQPYLLGTASGCASVTATQTGGESSTDQNSVLTADLDWGVKLRAEAFAGNKPVGKRWEYPKNPDERHLWFRDLAPGGSSALKPAVALPPSVIAAQRTDFKVRMPTCYPYPGRVQYQITWSGNATPTANVACSWQGMSGTCWFDPTKDLAFSLTWPNAGTYGVTVMLRKDDHRTFSSSPRVQHTVAVSAPGGGT